MNNTSQNTLPWQDNLAEKWPETPISRWSWRTLEQRPYMQRPGGSPDGQDLKQKGLKGVGQGQEVKITEVDKKYSSLGTSFKDFLADTFSDEYSFKSLDADSKKQQMELFGVWLKAKNQGKNSNLFFWFHKFHSVNIVHTSPPSHIFLTFLPYTSPYLFSCLSFVVQLIVVGFIQVTFISVSW